jgi:diaminopimelate decarboxylase
MNTEGHWSRHSGKTGDNHRQIFGADIVGLAEKYGTPLFILFEDIIVENYNRYRRALEEEYANHFIGYAVKANTSYDILTLLARCGSGADVASEYELRIALDAGIPPDKIRANGNCKSEPYLEECIRKEIIINVDPEEELEVINGIARRLGVTARVNLRLSGFPLTNITSSAITTSGGWSKFGISIQRAPQVFQKIMALAGLKAHGLMVHLGSQVTDITAYYTAMDILVELAKEGRKTGFQVQEIDLGGGWGIPYFQREEWAAIKDRIRNTTRENYTWADELIGYKYNPATKEMEWAGGELYCAHPQDEFIRKLFTEKFSGDKTLGQKLREIGSPRFVIEPGRSLVGNAGVTVARIGHVTSTPLGQNIIHIDAGVNCNTFGTAVPEQLHRLEIANNIEAQEDFETYVAGNLCFTGDLFGRIKNRLHRRPQNGDYLLLYDTGAYSDFFASNANSFPRPAKIMVAGDGSPRLLEEREDAAGAFRREPRWRKEHTAAKVEDFA